MSQFPASPNVIFSYMKDWTLLDFDPEDKGDEVPVFGRETTQPLAPEWIFELGGFIALATVPNRYLYVKDDKLFLTADGNKTAFFVENVVRNLWRILLPEQDKALKLEKLGVQVTAARKDDSIGELWYIGEFH